MRRLWLFPQFCCLIYRILYFSIVFKVINYCVRDQISPGEEISQKKRLQKDPSTTGSRKAETTVALKYFFCEHVR